MINLEPPRMAVWLLKQFASPYRRESLVADLLEMYGAGRSRGWYWRQVITALILARVRALRSVPRTALGPERTALGPARTALGPARTGLGAVLLRLVNALLLAGVIALGIGSLTQADTTRIDSHYSRNR
jgi:hypothetical protein